MVTVVGINSITGQYYKVEHIITGKVGDYNEYEIRPVE